MAVSLAFNLPFADAIASLQARRVVLPDDWYMMPATARKQTFTITGLSGLDQIAAVRDKMAAILTEGKSFKEFQAFAATLDWDVTPAHLETIYRNAVQTAYNAGAWKRFERGKLDRPYLMYSAVNDSRTRPVHRALSGIIRPVDDPFWHSHSPPLGHRCRCSLIALSADQARARSGGDNQGLNKAVTPDMVADGPDWGRKPTQWDATLAKLETQKLAQAGPLFDLPAFPPEPVFVGKVAGDFRLAVDAGLASLPDKVRQTVGDAGYAVIAGRTLTDIAPRLATAPPPRGYPAWATWAHVDGVRLGEERAIAVAESALLQNGSVVLTEAARVGAILRHEHAHVLDIATGASASPSFVAAYAADAAALAELLAAGRLNAGSAADIHYLLQAGQAGRQEAFADLVADLYGGGTAPWLDLTQAMPRTRETVRAIIDAFLREGKLP